MKNLDTVAQALELANEGNHRKARQILRKAVQIDPANERAWSGLAHLAHTQQEKMDCLHKVLEINPANQKARKKLADMQKRLIQEKVAGKIKRMQKKSEAGLRYKKWMTGIGIFTILVILLGAGGGLYMINIERGDTWLLSSFLAKDEPDSTIPVIVQASEKNVEVISEGTSAVLDRSRASFPPYSADIDISTKSNAGKPLPVRTGTATATVTVTSSATSVPTGTSTNTPAPTATPTNTQTVTLLPTQTSTVPATVTSSPSPIPSHTPPVMAYITSIQGKEQSLSLSCESRAAATWAGYFGFIIEEIEFFSRLPVSDNPENGFVGDVNGVWGQIPPEPYGIHAAPVAQLLKDIGLNAEAVYHARWEDVQNEIALGRPVIVWVVGHVEPGKAVPYQAEDGSTVMVARYQHTVILTGYDDEKEEVTILDGADTYTRPYDTFFQSWAVLGNMIVTISSKPAL